MANSIFIDHYKTLNIKLSATPDQIRAAFISLAKQQHPDAGGNLQEMRQINLAYSILRNPSTRQEYDRKYRLKVLDQDITEVGFSDSDEWDVDEVDEFISTVYREDQQKRWFSPVMICLTIFGVGMVLFLLVAASRMMVSADTVPAATPFSQKGTH